jgi:hypothetical protein
MKKIKLISIAVLFLSVCSSFQMIAAQENTKSDQNSDVKIQQAIEQEKKAMVEQKKEQEDANKLLEEKQSEMDEAMKDIRVEVETSDQGDDAMKIFRRKGDRSFRFDEPFVFSSPRAEAFFGHEGGGDSESTTWNFSKTVKENSFTREYSFDVEKTANSVVMSVNGDCKAGEIRIKIIMPNGKNYSDIVIDEFGNLNWRKSFNISETENQDKAGEWKFKIESTKATGYFKISLQTY